VTCIKRGHLINERQLESYVAPKGPLLCKSCQSFGHPRRNCEYLSGGCTTPRGQPQFCGCGGDHRANYRVRVKWKEVKATLAKQTPKRSRKSVATGQPATPKAQRASRSAEQMDLGEGWNHVVRGERVVKATKPNRRSSL